MDKLRNPSNLFAQRSWLNKYSLAVVAFVVWLAFFDKYNVFTQIKLSQSLNELAEKKSFYEMELEKAIKERDIINSDIEKYAREKYLMHKDNEQVIIIE
ncbi:MAG: septum formation initiator family protein [Saprospiraceae bacterium]|nr:septum formation initiator family protein [Saprospiraceae bacterium]